MRSSIVPLSRLLAAVAALASLAAAPARAEKEERHQAPPRAAPQRQAPPAREAPARPAPQQTQQFNRPPQNQFQRPAPQQTQQFNRPQPQQNQFQRPAPQQTQQFNRPQPQPQQNQFQQRPAPQQTQQFNRPQPQQNQFQRPAPQQTQQFNRPQPQANGAQRPGPAMRPAYTLPQNHPAMQPGARAQPLNQAESHQVLSQVNNARANMRGVNRAPLPQGNVTVAAGGGLHIASGNRSYAVRPNGTMASFSTPAHSARFRPDGTIASVHTNTGINISRTPGGGRMIVRARPNGTVIVSSGPHYGYVQRPVVFQNRTFVQRTYVSNGVVVVHAYHPFFYGGVVMNRYEPNYYYRPAYYRWCYSPWDRPIAWGWGWRSDPWYGYYGAYYQPLAVYPSPAYWLGDYLIAEELRESYDARVSAENAYAAGQADGYAEAESSGSYGEDAPPPSAPSPITPEVRAAIAEEVQRQLAEEQQAAQTGADIAPPAPPPAGYAEAPAPSDPGAPPPQGGPAPAQPDAETPVFLQTPGRVFVVSSPLDVAVDQDSCSLSAGDVLRLDAAPAAGEVSAQLRVLSSKGQDCTAGSVATLSVDDLQEMYNNLHAKIDSGLGALKAAQGSNGMPAAPTTAATPGPGAELPAPKDDTAAALAQTQRDADAAEAELNQEMKSQPAN